MPDARRSPVELDPHVFRELGHKLVDDIAALLDELHSPASRPVVPAQTPAEVQAAVGSDALPEHGSPAPTVLQAATDLLMQRSLHIGHPRFLGYVCGAPAPLGILSELLAAGVNPNLGGWPLSPVATEIERQVIGWLGEMIGFPAGDGILVSGGNMANFIGFLAARRAKAPWDVRSKGLGEHRFRVYCSVETHTWIQKATDMFGLGTESIRWIETDTSQAMRVDALQHAVDGDRAAGDIPFLVVGTAGSVSTGAVDPLHELRSICDSENLWLHVDGAYGGFAACLPDAPPELKALREADSVAVDPHKWMYMPLEAGALLVRDPRALVDAFSYHPQYYELDDETVNYHEHGPQNSRGFRALKVWLVMRQAGRQGYVASIAEDCRLARVLYDLCAADAELDARMCNLSITTFRFHPDGIKGEELDELNQELVARIQHQGEVFISNAVIDGSYFLRACFVNFRTTEDDVRALTDVVKRTGAELATAARTR
jgi:glutamate/tyrosine decarboxylase-like PLP-dependent enzyme